MAVRTHHFHLLDGMRGIAACVVLWFHLGLPKFGHGYLAVDFFFLLSGFVLTHSYQQQLDAGMAFRDFMTKRVVRLYPLYLLGMLLGVICLVPRIWKGSLHLSWFATVGDLLLGLCFFPTPTAMGTGNGAMFPFNVVSWSLFFELLANAGHALFLRRRRTRTLLVISALAIAGLVCQALRTNGLDLGTRTDQLFGGLWRVTFSYVTGMLLLRVLQKKVARLNVPAAVPMLLLLMLLYPARGGWVYDVVAVAVVLPCVLLLAACVSVFPNLVRLCTALGAVSYAIYALHTPVLLTTGALIRKSPFRLPPLERQLATAAAIILMTSLIARYYDLPARALLRRKLMRVSGRNCRGKC